MKMKNDPAKSSKDKRVKSNMGTALIRSTEHVIDVRSLWICSVI